MAQYKSSTTYSRLFLMVLSSDHITGATGKTVTVNLSKAGATFAAAGGTVSEVANGWYKIVLNTTDTNTLGDLAFDCTASGCDNTDFADQVIGYDPTAAQLPTNVLQWNSSNVASPATPGIPDINIRNINNAAVSTSTAQLGVNTVNIAGQAAALDANNLLKVDVEDVNGSATIETGITLKQALQYVSAAVAGVLAGAAGTTVTISAINNAGTTRISATVDANGDRSAVTLS